MVLLIVHGGKYVLYLSRAKFKELIQMPNFSKCLEPHCSHCDVPGQGMLKCFENLPTSKKGWQKLTPGSLSDKWIEIVRP